MVRRVNLPSADDLFRPTTGESESEEADERASVAVAAPAGPSRARTTRARPARRGATDRQPSGRVRHEEKMTVYVTAEELLDIEAARLALRSHHGLAVDRGRLVREAVAMVLAELDAEGEDSRLVRRLSGPEQ